MNPTRERGTHISFYSPVGEWKLKSGEAAGFWQSYCDHASSPNVLLSIGERVPDSMHVVFELNLSFDLTNDVKWRHPEIWETFLSHFVMTAQYSLLELVEIDLSTNPICLVATVLTRPPSTASALIGKDRITTLNYSFQIHFPFIYTETSLITQLFRPRLIRNLHAFKLTNLLDRETLLRWGDNLHFYSVDDWLPMYRSSEEATKPPYSLLYTWPYIPLESAELIPPNIPIGDLIDLTNHNDVIRGLVSEQELINDEIENKHWIPMLLSVSHFPYMVKIRDEHLIVNLPSEEVFRDFGERHDNEREELPMETAHRFLRMIAETRFLEEESWEIIGRALYSVSNGGPDGLNTWLEYTERAISSRGARPEWLNDDYRSECGVIYDTFYDSSYTIKTLGWFARLDSPALYTEWHSSWVHYAAEDFLMVDANSAVLAAEILYRMFWLEYICVSLRHNSWYFFTGHLWNDCENGSDLRNCISRDLLEYFKKIQEALEKKRPPAKKSYSRRGNNTNNNNDNGDIHRAIRNVLTTPFIENVMKEAKFKFHFRRFVEFRDRNTDLMGLLNGVLQATSKRIHIRNGIPEDYLTRTTGTPYHSYYTWEHPIVMELNLRLQMIFPDPGLYNRMMRFCASLLRGRNRLKIFPIFTGDGNNGKSVFIKLLEAVFKGYLIKLPVTSICGKYNESSSGPSPQMARGDGARLAIIQEPEDNQEMNKGLIKGLTGGDSYFARMLHENGRDIVATFILILVCNAIPLIPRPDRATKSRLEIFPFLSMFVPANSARETFEEQMQERRFPMDYNLEDKMSRFASAFLWIMVQWYEQFLDEGIGFHPEVEQIKNEYWENTDVFHQFIGAKIIAADTTEEETGRIIPDPTKFTSMTDIYDCFQRWYAISYPGTKPFTRSMLKSELTVRFGRQMEGPGWYGIQLNEQEGNSISYVGKQKDANQVAQMQAYNQSLQQNSIVPGLDPFIPGEIAPSAIGFDFNMKAMTH